jgi:GTP-dependent phosphoenolpyruvate carboxykinase
MAMSETQFAEISKIDPTEWANEAELQGEIIDKLKSRIPKVFSELQQKLAAHFR